jgi:hypothetical protein
MLRVDPACTLPYEVLKVVIKQWFTALEANADAASLHLIQQQTDVVVGYLLVSEDLRATETADWAVGVAKGTKIDKERTHCINLMFCDSCGEVHATTLASD